ncbi:MAG: cell division protein ZapD [Pseudomonadota bacterium]|nr:cell division protein ZapD [Gammaproteobacteria bacterium]MBU1558577.1 cell division protein ZapD [Gammaproteobacteria bacterium]MBU1628461.1 cell division protein ZapD [Gammaproteobacteria bacterium]MBU2546566.1 cell division protein ZapD [Gammaproteobacteria bacterium]
MEEIDQIIYEQPLNELIRTCLRLEHLFNQIHTCLNALDAAQHSQAIVRLITDILTILDRPDLKSKITKELNRQIAVLTPLAKSSSISQQKLEETLRQLNTLLNYFVSTPGKVAQNLRDNEFLGILRPNLITPGGGSCVDTPGYHYWLQQPSDVRFNQIDQWLKEFKYIKNAVDLLLTIVRNSSEARSLLAVKGFYHEPLDSGALCQLIRVILPAEIECYPEISLGRHHISIRFVIPNIEARVSQTHDDIPFRMTVCTI